MRDPEICVASWTEASAEERRTGVLGYLRVAYGSLELDGITLRETADGERRLSFPARFDRSGRRHSLVRPVDDAARTAIEREVLHQLHERSFSWPED